MDLPWNPAVLEQRIGRVHRLGQRNPVQVINFIAQGTIEEGMLQRLPTLRGMVKPKGFASSTAIPKRAKTT